MTSNGLVAPPALGAPPEGLRRRRVRITAPADELGGADVLVNNAGVMLLGPLASDQRDDYRRMIEVNLLGAITTTEVFLDQLKDGAGERGGDIVNISSVAGRTARAGNGVHAATELPNHVTHPGTRDGVQHLYDQAQVSVKDIGRSSPSPSVVPGTSPSTKSCCDPQARSDLDPE